MGIYPQLFRKKETIMKKFSTRIITLTIALVMVLGMSVVAAEAPVATKEEGFLNIATNAEFPPYEYKEDDGFAGIDIEIAGAIAEELGLELKVNDVEFGSIIGGVQTGKYDMGIAGMTVTEERLESINFSDSYATGIQVVIVKEDSEIASVDDLEGKKIGVQQDTTGDIYCVDDFGDENVTEFKTGADAVQALVAGKVDCVVIDNEPAKSYVEAAKGLKILETEYVTEEYAICIAKENEELLNAVNGVLAELKESGKLQEIVDKYISADEGEAEEAAAE
jgi:polar amino acid transport system substrate-binding protein